MLVNPRKQRSFKGKITVYILLLIILVFLIFFLNLFFLSQSSSLISPMGKSNIDVNRVEKILKDKNILFSSVVVLGDSYLISISNNGQVRLSLGKDIEKQISSLQRMLIALTIEGKTFKNIDFRFAEPIISY